MKWDLVKKEQMYSGFFTVDKCHLKHELYEGGETEIVRELLHRGDAVAVLLYDPAHDKVVMIEQFRIGEDAAVHLPCAHLKLYGDPSCVFLYF